MKNPKIVIELNKTFSLSHVYINDVEIPALSVEVEKIDGGNPLVKAKIEVWVDILKVDPSIVKFIEYKLKDRK